VFCSELVAAAYKAMGLLPEAKAAVDYLPSDFASVRYSGYKCIGCGCSPAPRLQLQDGTRDSGSNLRCAQHVTLRQRNRSGGWVTRVVAAEPLSRRPRLGSDTRQAPT
jgi:hypothetical protein